MDHAFLPVSPIKSALFIDFDNIYIGLSKTDPQAAERFASDPARWLAWLERGLPNRSEAAARPRSILIRRCYPNPDAGFRRYRSFFTSAAFSVIDCPSLTRTGKNSADIYMVMDILDMLSHKTYFDEFIIFSGDSDFMPVLLRLRAHDRRTTTLAIDFMPPAYKAACDLVISEEEFIEDALGLSHDACAGGAPYRSRVPLVVLKEMAARVYEAVCADGEVAGANLPEILKDFREFRDSTNWLGFGTSQRLAEALICSEPRLQLVRLSPLTYKLILKPQVMPTEITLVKKPSRPAPVKAVQGPVKRFEEEKIQAEKGAAANRAGIGEKPAKAELTRLRAQVIEIVREMVAGSRSAVLLARASQQVVSKLGPQVLSTQWAGMGSFKRLLQNTSDLGLEITTQPEPGYIFDPKRHTLPARRGQVPAPLPETSEPAGEPHEPPAEPQERLEAEAPSLEAEGLPAEEAVLPETEEYLLEKLPEPYEDEEEEGEEEDEEYEESLPSLEEFIRRVSQVTGAPDLAPKQYALVFRGIINELQGIADGQKTYNTYQTSKSVSDWCEDQGESIARSDAVLILKGIIFQDGVRFSKRPESYTANDLAEIFRDNIHALCRRSRLDLSEYDERLLDEWMLGGLEEDYPEDAQDANETGDGSLTQE